jgi:hypothetical protein
VSIAAWTRGVEGTWQADVRRVAYWLSLGAAAGGLVGVLVGGVGGRLAMLLLRFTTSANISGIESDDGFVMGRFDVASTLQLLFVTAVLGSVAGLVIVAARPFLPWRWMPVAWGIAGGTVAGAIIVHTDGVDFALLEPTGLAVALFVIIPAVGAALIALFVEAYRSFWWRKGPATAAAALAGVPAIVFFPVLLVALAAGALWSIAMRWELRRAPQWRAVRIAAVVVFAGVTILGAIDLARDANRLL